MIYKTLKFIRMKSVQNPVTASKGSKNYVGTLKANKTAKEASAFKELIVDELKDIYWAEGYLVKNLPKIAKAATSLDLKKAFENHLKETETHVSTLEKVFKALGETPKAKTCDAMMGLVKEAQGVIKATEEGTKVRDVALIMAAQKIEHYEIASYGTL